MNDSIDMRRLLLSLAAVCTLTAAAQDDLKWALTVPQSGETVLMERVGFLLAADDSDTFSVVCTDGRVIGGVSEITFVQTDPSGIARPVAPAVSPSVYLSAGSVLRVTGCRAGTQLGVYDEGGRRVVSCTAGEGTTAVNIGSLPHGVYMLKAGDTAIRFMKK